MIRNCPVCDSGLHSNLHENVVVCRVCGMGYAREMEPVDYAGHSVYASPIAMNGTHQFPEIMASRIENKKTKILEVGCASGELLVGLRELGFENVSGMDPSEGAVNRAKERGLNAWVGGVGQELNEKYDVILFSHVLEHLTDPAAALIWARNYADTLFIEVPDASRYKDYLFSPFQDFNAEHINHFSLGTMGNLVNRCGWRRAAAHTRTFDLIPGIEYPALWAILEKDNVPEALNIWNDPHTAYGLRKYVEKSEELLRDLAKKFRSHVNGSGKVILWGAGTFCNRLLESPEMSDVELAGCIDGNPVRRDRWVRNCIVSGPEVAQQNPEIPILVASILNRDKILQNIQFCKLTNPVISAGQL